MNLAITRALEDAREAYERRGILVVSALEARNRPRNEEAVEQALYTIFRGLPARLPPGAILYVSTVDRAGGDVELAWHAREERELAPPDASAREALRSGPDGDLVDLAVLGLEEIARARTALREEPVPAIGDVSSPVGRALARRVTRRFTVLLPGAPG